MPEKAEAKPTQWVPFLRDIFTVIPGEEEYFWAGKRRLFKELRGKWQLVVGCAEQPFEPDKPLSRGGLPMMHLWRIEPGIDSLANNMATYGETNLELLRSLASEQQDILIGTPSIYYLNPAPRYCWEEEKQYRYLYEEVVLVTQPLHTNSNSFDYFEQLGLLRESANDEDLTLMFSGIQLTGRPGVICNVWRVPPACKSVADAIKVLHDRLTEKAVRHLNRAVASIDRKLLVPIFTERLEEEANGTPDK